MTPMTDDDVGQHCSLVYIGIIGNYSLSLVHFFLEQKFLVFTLN